MTGASIEKEKPVALVTGASSGLGKTMAQALVADGYRVFGTSRNPAKTTPVDGIAFVALNVDNDASVEAAVASVIEQAGQIDLLLCNAGFGVMGPIEDTPVADMAAQFETNVFGVHRVSRAVLPHLRKRPAAKLIVVGSLAGVVGVPYQGMYSASKFALEGYCEALRLELRDSTVRVSIIEPGDFPTGFTSSRTLVDVANVSPAHREKFPRAMAIVEEDENNGGDLALIAQAISRLAADPAPPLRTVVCSDEQMEMVDARPTLSPDEWEDIMAEHFGLDPAAEAA